MALAVGSRLGSYEILAPVGAGGMGEVYRARDTRLRREVALKVPTDVAPVFGIQGPGRASLYPWRAERTARPSLPNRADLDADLELLPAPIGGEDRSGEAETQSQTRSIAQGQA